MISAIPKLECYVIYNHFKGLYSKGGTMGDFATRPKMWSSVGAVKNHLALFINRHYEYDFTPERKQKCSIIISKHYKGCVVLNLVDGTEPFKIHHYLREKAEKDIKRYSLYTPYTLVDEWDEQCPRDEE
jgi:hypothetical protein